ncbi:type II CAAX endopeptidase family protein [Thermotalea metallivorans]|uniref:CAAX prenyl protease 2/Lysostaphin resistance protein A-like domain-containing protein n=1 Tax=Thermotalea metallivorans TaxID=520762 RepID=A0A140L242_9FIRM|nr:type II CAAX endopeptidase family protein [Thermotalea metallivorans]KXG74617.1 hypothetical protein AN619_22570 [Thermotalea metallivorans]
MKKKKGIDILGVNILYFVVALLLLTVGSYVQYREIKSGLMITEYILVLLPAILYIKMKRESLREVLRFNSISIKHGFLIVCITILSYPVALFFNLIAMTILSTLGKLERPPIPTADSFQEYVVLMLIIAASAGICEEVFFRGLLMKGYERLGKENAIVLTAVLFGVFHFNLQNLLGPIVLGLIFGYLVCRTDSIFAGIVGHMTNNGLAVTLGFLLNMLNRKLAGGDFAMGQQGMPDALQLAAATVIVGMGAVLSGGVAYMLLRVIIKDTEGSQHSKEEERLMDEEANGEETGKHKISLVAFIPVFLTLALFFVVGYLQIRQIS